MNMDNLIEAQDGAPAQKFEPLEDGATYRVRFPNSDDPRDGAEFMEILHHSGYWISPNDGDMGPARVEEVDYEVVAKVD